MSYLPISHESHTALDLSLNQVSGVVAASFSGVRFDISDITTNVIQAISTVLPPAAGIAMTISSTSAADVGVVVRIFALGPNGAYVAPFNVTLNGTTPVAIGTFSRINTMSRVSGDIAGTVTVVNGANVYGFIEIGGQIMRSATYCIPVGYRLVIQTIIGAMLKSGGADAGVTFSLRIKPLLSSVFGPIIAMAAYRAGNSQIQVSQEYGGGTAGPVDLQVAGLASTPGCDAQIYVSGILINDNFLV